jgi:site-specific recombinase XerD
MSEIEIAKRAELETLEEGIKRIANESKAKNTRLAYRSDWRVFERWAESMGLEAYPAAPKTIALYIAHLQKLRRKPATVARHLTSIKKYHQLAGADHPITEHVRELLAGVRRLEGIYPSKKRPITLEVLRRCLEQSSSDFIGIRNKAILLVGWAGAFRRSELAAMTCEDLEDDEKGIIVTIRKSKTDQIGKGRRVGLPFVDHDHSLCAPRALRRWRDLSRIRTGPIWRRVGKHGRGSLYCWTDENAITGKNIALIVKEMVKAAGYDPAHYAGHSLRAGLCTTLAVAGIEERRIADITGHRSVEVLRGYVHDARILTDHPIIAALKASD